MEQDLPRELNPLPDLYEHYWKPNANHPFFPPFEEFFSQWWDRRLKPLDEFIRKYFWGCSYEFVRLGLEARLYRTAISIWTQFHFCYRWQASCTLSLQAAPELDSQGIDALIQVRAEHLVGIQIKKESYRKEARGENRFVRKRQIDRQRSPRNSLHLTNARGTTKESKPCQNPKGDLPPLAPSREPFRAPTQQFRYLPRKLRAAHRRLPPAKRYPNRSHPLGKGGPGSSHRPVK